MLEESGLMVQVESEGSGARQESSEIGLWTVGVLDEEDSGVISCEVELTTTVHLSS